LSCTTINDVVSKFVNSCTEVTGQPNTAIYFKNYTQRGGNRGRGNYRGNFRSRNNNYINNDTQYNNGQCRGNYRDRGNSSRGHNNNNPSNVQVTNNTSGNSKNPLDT